MTWLTRGTWIKDKELFGGERTLTKPCVDGIKWMKEKGRSLWIKEIMLEMDNHGVSGSYVG